MKIFAHRGLSEYAPENTLTAFEMAIEKGAEAIEFDVQYTADGEIVVIHDFILGRTANGSGMVKDKNWDELKTLDAGSWFGENFRGIGIARLEEVLKALPANVLLNIELKRIAMDRRAGFAEELVRLIRQYPREYIVSSFDHYLLREVQEIDADVPLGLLYCSGLIDVIGYAEENGLKISAIHPSIEYVNTELVEQAHRRNIKVNVYTIKAKEQAQAVRVLGVDGIFVNHFDFISPSGQESIQ